MKFQKNNQYKFSPNNSKSFIKKEFFWIFNSLEEPMTIGRLQENETFTFLEDKILYGIKSTRGAVYGIKIKNKKNKSGWILFTDLNIVNKNTSFYDVNSNKIDIQNNSNCLN